MNKQKITLVMDSLNTHNPRSLYEAFLPDKAKALQDKSLNLYISQNIQESETYLKKI